MKKYISIIALFLSGCQILVPERVPVHEGLIILLDQTDSFQMSNDLTALQIANMLKVGTSDENAGATVTLVPITNLRTNQTFITRIQDVSDGEGDNEAERIMEVDSFRSRLEAQLQKVRTLPIGKSRSLILESLAKHLTNLMACKDYTSRKLIVVSDLLENGSAINAYDSLQLVDIEHNPGKYISLIDTRWHFPSVLKGVEIIIVYIPNEKTDYAYNVMYNLISRYLIKKGATVSQNTGFEY